MTVIAQLDLEQTPAVVLLLWDYRDDPPPPDMVPPEYENVTDVDPQPQPGFTYDGTYWMPGEPQEREKVRATVADTTEEANDANRGYLEIKNPTSDEIAAQVTSLTQQMITSHQVELERIGRAQDWSEFQEAPDIGLPEVELAAAFTFTPAAPKVHASVQFDASASTGTIARYDWDFGDKNTATEAGPTLEHAYDHKGTYTVTLVITDEDGETDEAESSIKII